MNLFSRACFLPLVLFVALRVGCDAAPRPILVCVDQAASPAIKQAVTSFITRANKAPLLNGLRVGGEAGEVTAISSAELLEAKAYDRAAHSHLVVIGLRSKDALLAKTWGVTVTIDETKRQAFSLGFGYLQGDIGWVESDRNPFLHSPKIKSAPEDTILVKITGTSEAGVLAALKAFEGGLLTGFVPRGAISRPRTTLIDRDPSVEPAPFALPLSVTAETGPATLVGWTQVPENEYRAVLETSGATPQRMWRYKYLAAGMLEEKPIVRWFGGVNRKSMGNVINLLEFASSEQALAAARQMTGKGFTTRFGDGRRDELWKAPWPNDKSESTDRSYGNTFITARGRYVFVSTLPEETTLKLVAVVR